MNSIWKRYFFAELIKVFFLVIGCLYFLYVLIDYSAHTKVFQQEGIRLIDVLLYYLFQFTKRAEILIPVALMIATIKVLTTANMRHEIVALATGGISLKKIMRPFLWSGLFLTLLLFLNFQYLQPFSLIRLNAFEEQYFKEHTKEEKKNPINSLLLEDNTLLLYQSYDQERRAFFDVYWLKNGDSLYRIQWLYPYEKIPFGNYVDSLSRNSCGDIVKVNSHEELFFPHMRFDTKSLYSAVHPPRWQSISQLGRNLKRAGMKKSNDREAEVATLFFYKLTIPFVCILAVFCPAPYCLRFGRNLPVFLIYALSLFGIITFFTLVNTSVILGESQVIPPFWAILTPPLVFSLLFGWKYARM